MLSLSPSAPARSPEALNSTGAEAVWRRALWTSSGLPDHHDGHDAGRHEDFCAEASRYLAADLDPGDEDAWSDWFTAHGLRDLWAWHRPVRTCRLVSILRWYFFELQRRAAFLDAVDVGDLCPDGPAEDPAQPMSWPAAPPVIPLAARPCRSARTMHAPPVLPSVPNPTGASA